MMSDQERDPRGPRRKFDWKEDPDWFKSIGPEDEDPEVIAENLEEYGWNQMGEDFFGSNPVAPSDMPDWTNEAVYGDDRALMPEGEEEIEDLLDELDEEDL
jgi:hypothetical protein